MNLTPLIRLFFDMLGIGYAITVEGYSLLTVNPIPAFTDNYIWLIELENGECAVVDPGDAGPVLQYLEQHGRTLSYILLTHHHHDHTGGVPALLERYPVVIYGPEDARLPRETIFVGEGDSATVQGLEFAVIDLPGHTSSHIAFFGAGCLFSGDTLFSVGCGRLFEGTPAQMQNSLDKLAALPPETLVYCGHEYTQGNCAFALQVEPDNTALQERSGEAARLRAENRVTLPSSIGSELATNPFMRSRQPAVVAAAQKRGVCTDDPASVLAIIRAWKDRL
jgi:hydroxyacylglutathione hydrolase